MDTTTFVKKTSWALVFILIGIGLALLYFQNFNRRHQFNFVNAPKRNWADIGDKGKDLMSNYLNEQENIWPHYFRLRTGDKEEILRGFWIDKKMLDKMNSDVAALPGAPVVNGYHVFFGKWDEDAKRYYSLVVRASQGIANAGVGNYFDMVDPCPDNCGGNK